MKILYIYNKFPSTYQKYLVGLLSVVKQKLQVKTLVYDKDFQADYPCVSYGFKDKIQRLKYKIGLSKYPSLDLKIMCDFDVIHLQHSYLWRKVLPLKKISKKPKIIITLRGGDTYIKPWIDTSWREFYSNSEWVNAFIVMSQNQKEYLTRWGVPESKIEVIPISFGSHSDTKPKYPNPDKLKLVAAFRMTWEKNIEGTLRFAHILKTKNVNFSFDIYGDGNDLGQLHYLIDKLELKNHVFPKGKIENKQLKLKLSDYDFMIQLSHSESLGMSVIEAQSQGVPCVVSDSGGLPEIVDFGNIGIIITSSNYENEVEKIISLWKEKDDYYHLSEKAINFVNKNYTTYNEFERLKILYDRIRKN